METPRPLVVACAAGALLLAASGVASLRLPPFLHAPAEGSGVACKAVRTPKEARGCASVEFDLNLTKDGVWVLNHDRDFEGKLIAEQTWDELKGRLGSLDEFAKGAARERFLLVNLDLKERSFWPGEGRLTQALERHRAALRSLAKDGVVVVSSPIPARYAELHRFLLRPGLPRVLPALELADYDAAQAKRWGLPLSRLETLSLPLARLASRAYLTLNARAIPWLIVQEATARASLPAGPELVCWSREKDPGDKPDVCPWTQRAR